MFGFIEENNSSGNKDTKWSTIWLSTGLPPLVAAAASKFVPRGVNPPRQMHAAVAPRGGLTPPEDAPRHIADAMK